LGWYYKLLVPFFSVDDGNAENINTWIMVSGTGNNFSSFQINKAGFAVNWTFLNSMDSGYNDYFLVRD
jgi:hypothetical protein